MIEVPEMYTKRGNFAILRTILQIKKTKNSLLSQQLFYKNMKIN